MARALQIGDTGLHGQHAALHVRGEDRVDVLLGHVGQLDVGEDTGVRADDVDAAEPRRGLGGEPLAVRSLGHVAGDEGDLPALARQVAHGGLARRGVPAVHDEVRAGACEHAGDSLADALGSTGDEHRAARDRCEHPQRPLTVRLLLLGERANPRRVEAAALYGSMA